MEPKFTKNGIHRIAHIILFVTFVNTRQNTITNIMKNIGDRAMNCFIMFAIIVVMPVVGIIVCVDTTMM